MKNLFWLISTIVFFGSSWALALECPSLRKHLEFNGSVQHSKRIPKISEKWKFLEQLYDDYERSYFHNRKTKKPPYTRTEFNTAHPEGFVKAKKIRSHKNNYFLWSELRPLGEAGKYDRVALLKRAQGKNLLLFKGKKLVAMAKKSTSDVFVWGIKNCKVTEVTFGSKQARNWVRVLPPQCPAILNSKTAMEASKKGLTLFPVKMEMMIRAQSICKKL